jgi:hypothetical protein
MKKIQGVVVAALLAIWFFPAVSLAQPAPADPAPLPAVVTEARAPVAAQPAATNGEAARLAQRERQSPNLQDYKGGAAVIYVGSGVLLVVVIVLLLLLV